MRGAATPGVLHERTGQRNHRAAAVGVHGGTQFRQHAHVDALRRRDRCHRGRPGVHTNGIPAQYLDAPPPAGVAFSAGPPVGFVILFSNGLRAYLSGDTGVTNEMEMVARVYRPTLAIINVTISIRWRRRGRARDEQYIRPVTVMPSHVNEQATSGGAEVAGSRVDSALRGSRAGLPTW